MTLDLTDAFPRNYSVVIDAELPPASGPDYCFPKGSYKGGGMLVRVMPNGGRAWLGHFRAGDVGSGDHVASTPDPDHLVVVCGGAAYLGSARDPERWQEIGDGTVGQVLPAPEPGLLLLGGYCDVMALDQRSVAWRTDGIASDELRMERVEGSVLFGSCFCGGLERVPFTVDLKTGRYKRGSTPGGPAATRPWATNFGAETHRVYAPATGPLIGPAEVARGANEDIGAIVGVHGVVCNRIGRLRDAVIHPFHLGVRQGRHRRRVGRLPRRRERR